MRVFVTKWFDRFARKEKLKDETLCEAILRAERGSVDADLGGGLIKQRVARSGKGRSGGYRTIVAYREADRGVFLYGFAKNERDNIDPRELRDLKRLAEQFLTLKDHDIGVALQARELRELTLNEEENDNAGEIPKPVGRGDP